MVQRLFSLTMSDHVLYIVTMVRAKHTNQHRTTKIILKTYRKNWWRMKHYHNQFKIQLIRLMYACALSNWSDLHSDFLEGVAHALPISPNDLDVCMTYSTMRCVHAIDINIVAGTVPESTQIMLSAVLIPLVLVFVKSGELHVVVVWQTIT